MIIILANMSLNGMSMTYAVTFATSDIFMDFYSNDHIWKCLTLNSLISKTQRGILFRFSRFASSYLLLLQLVLCRVTAVNSLPVKRGYSEISKIKVQRYILDHFLFFRSQFEFVSVC